MRMGFGPKKGASAAFMMTGSNTGAMVILESG